MSDRHVVIVEDIVDSGHTLQRLRSHVSDAGAASVAVAALLDKQCRRTIQVDIEYVGFVCPDKFVVGCGSSSHFLALGWGSELYGHQPCGRRPPQLGRRSSRSLSPHWGGL